MKPECRTFRAALEHCLAGGAVPSALQELGWHEHLLGCEACRALVANEEALELLLASLPEPRLPKRLANRLLVRLRAEHHAVDAELDELLDVAELDRTNAAPDELARDVLAKLAPARAEEKEAVRAARDAKLDALLDREKAAATPHGLAERVANGARASFAAEQRALDLVLARDLGHEAPRELARRVLAGLESSRERAPHELRPEMLVGSRATDLRWRRAFASRARSRPEPRRFVVVRSTYAWALAAGVAAAIAAWVIVSRSNAPRVAPPFAHEERRGAPEHLLDPRTGAPTPSVLAALDVLEQWDLLLGNDVDLLLSTLGPADQTLLDVDVGAAPLDEGPKDVEKPPEGGRKG